MTTTAQAAPDRHGLAAMLFAYRISDAQKFDAAYRDHLGWHRDRHDHLTWYGWYVIAGSRTGVFVDGTFGSDFAAIDRRPDPKGDAEHFTNGAAHHSTAIHYSAWALWPEASTDFSLEDRQPSAMVDALVVTPRPGQSRELEQALTPAAREQHDPRVRWTWYRSAAGERLPSYMVLIPRSSWADIAARPNSLGALAAAALELPASEAERIDALIDKVEAETWRYRADLSLFPEGQ